MDPITSLGAGASPGTGSAIMGGLGGLDGDAFMNLLVTQLRYQDPLAPTDTQGLLQNTSMLAQTEMLTKVSQMQQQLLGLQRATMATDLIGEHVAGVTQAGVAIEGTVDSVRFSAAGPVLAIGSQELSLDDATRIGGSGGAGAAPVTTADPGTPATTGTGPSAADTVTGPAATAPWSPGSDPGLVVTATGGRWTPPTGSPLTFALTTPASNRLSITLGEGTSAGGAVARIREQLAGIGDGSITVSAADDTIGPLVFTSPVTGPGTRFTIAGLGPDLDGTHTVAP